MPDSSEAKKTKAESEVKKTKPLPKKADILAAEPLAAELAHEWSSPGDWFHQHLYIE